MKKLDTQGHQSAQKAVSVKAGWKGSLQQATASQKKPNGQIRGPRTIFQTVRKGYLSCLRSPVHYSSPNKLRP